MDILDIHAGMRVRYVPTHAFGDVRHKDVENGIVKSKNDSVVFVNYIRNNVLQETAQSTRPEDLIEG